MKKECETVTIKEVSQKYNISSDTLRYYERVGMIPPVTRTAGGIRDYSEYDLGWVELALCMRIARQMAGLPLDTRLLTTLCQTLINGTIVVDYHGLHQCCFRNPIALRICINTIIKRCRNMKR